jgi:adenosylcobinamide-phosphate synthase
VPVGRREGEPAKGEPAARPWPLPSTNPGPQSFTLESRQLLYGAALALALPAAAALLPAALTRLCRRLGPAGVAAEALLLGSSFAVKGLDRAAGSVQDRLARGDLVGARAALPALVSRDPTGLSAPLVAAAAIESVAENFGDSVVAPWLAYALFGTPGALAYRALNTIDSMIGYHGRHEWLGKAGARLDDLANLLPARLAAALLALAGARPGRAWAVARREHGRTASPNAGWPMAAMAGALDVRLEKVDHYVLNPHAAAPAPADIRRALARYRRAVALAAAGVLAMLLAKEVWSTDCCQRIAGSGTHGFGYG